MPRPIIELLQSQPTRLRRVKRFLHDFFFFFSFYENYQGSISFHFVICSFVTGDKIIIDIHVLDQDETSTYQVWSRHRASVAGT